MLNRVGSISGENEETMSQGNLMQSYSWETEYNDEQIQFSRPMPDEVISVYEVYVKEEMEGPDSKTETAIIPNLANIDDQQLIQVIERCKECLNGIDFQTIEIVFKAGCIDLESAIGSEMVNVDGTVTKLLTKDALKYKILDHQSVNATDENILFYSQPLTESSSSSTTRMIDKDDPRSRLHFVKYLKRDGKTLKIWECGICSKEFRHQYTLMRHLPTHTDERNFKCEACGKAFRQLSTLSQHKAIHSDARPYVCEFCKKTFNRVSTLISHRKTHSEHKPHKCHLCGKGFHQKGNLRNHVFTHTNERPYKCDLCGKGFNQMSNLVCHKVKAHAHTEKGQYACGICGKEFPRRFSLRSHEEYKHGIKYRQPASFTSDVNDQDIIKNKNVRVVHMPNDVCDPTVEAKDNKNELITPEYMDGVVIDKIETKSMEYALLQRQTPFALFKPIKGMPILVKISPTVGQKHILTPATAEDLRAAGKMGLSPTLTADADGNKAVQLKVPVVATVVQKAEPDGKFSFIIEAPAPEHEEENFVTSLDAQLTFAEPIRSEADRQNDLMTSPATEDCNELLELAAQGGIQFVRATEDGRYEVMTNNEARELMAQNSHDMTILDGAEADAINVVNIRNNGDVIIGDSDNQIMVLDANSTQKSIPMDGIEILEDKDIRILDGKGFDDRFVDGITFLPHTKIDDFILGSKPLGMDTGVAVIEHDDDGSSELNGQHDLAGMLNQRSDLSTMSTVSQTSISSLLTKNHPLSLLSDNSHYLKNSQNLADDLGILTGSPMSDHHTDYDTKIKLPVFDDHDTDSILTPISQAEIKVLSSKSQDPKLIDARLTLSPTKVYPGVNQIKILGPKNHSQELLSSQYQDMKLLSQYEEFLKNSSPHLNGYNYDMPVITKKEVKILGKKLETGVISSTDEGEIIEVLEEKSKSVVDAAKDFSCNSDSMVSSSPRLDKHSLEQTGADSFLLQACSPCGSDFLSFENRFNEKDAFPVTHFERIQKESRNSFTAGGLPDLD